MNVALAPSQIAALFPAYLIVLHDGRLRAMGPAIAARLPLLSQGAALTDHFTIEPADWSAQTSNDGQSVRLSAIHDNRIQLSGSAVTLDDGILLALNLMPDATALESGDFALSDFSPSDPAVPGLIHLALQRQILSDAHRTADELDQERNRRAELWQRISRVAGHMAHDFANVFSIITLNARRLASEGRLSSDDRRLARIIEKTVERGAGATHSLMTMAQQQHDSPAPASVDRIIRDNRHFLSTVAGPSVEISLDLQSGDATCVVSRSGLLHALVDLIVQARDAMPHGGAITIASALRSADASHGDMLEVRVKRHPAASTGIACGEPSMPWGAASIDDNPKPSLVGVDEFVRASGGAFSHREDAHLSAFHLPVISPFDISGASALVPVAEGRAGLRCVRVLVVEDEAFALDALVELLTSDGFAVTGASTYLSALDALERGFYDVLLSDVVLPSGSGLALGDWVSRERPWMRIILMSGYVPDRSRFGAGWYFLRKPLDVSSLRRLLGGA